MTQRTMLLLLVFVVLAVYYPALFVPINSVDDLGMYNYLLNTNHFSFRDIFLPGGSGAYYRPLLVVSFLADKYIWGLEESFMHLENILFHLANTLLLFAIGCRVSKLLVLNSIIPAFLAALFFAIHPINTESVIWISGRTDLLACFFLLLSTYFLLNLSRTVVDSLLAGLFLLMACFAKDTAIFFLPAVLILPFFLSNTRINNNWSSFILVARQNLPHFLVISSSAVTYFLFRSLAFNRGDQGVQQVMTNVIGGQSENLTLTLRLILKATGFYVKKLFVPFPLNFSINHVSDLYIIVALLLIAAIIYMLIRRTIPNYFFIAAASVGSSALLVPLLKMTWTPLAERYMYIPSAFFMVGLVFVLYPRLQQAYLQKIATLLVVGFGVIAVYATSQRAILWQDNLALYEDCRRKSPDFIPAQNEIANALYARGKQQEAYDIISSITPPKDLVNSQYLSISKAATLAGSGKLLESQSLLQSALKNPGKHEVVIIGRLLKLNDSLVTSGKITQQQIDVQNRQLLARLYQLTQDPFELYRLGQVHLRSGDKPAAKQSFTKAWKESSPDSHYHAPAKRLSERL